MTSDNSPTLTEWKTDTIFRLSYLLTTMQTVVSVLNVISTARADFSIITSNISTILLYVFINNKNTFSGC